MKTKSYILSFTIFCLAQFSWASEDNFDVTDILHTGIDSTLFTESKICLLGEYHMLRGNQKLIETLVCQVSKISGDKILLMELPISYGAYLQAYTERGNLDSLNLLLQINRLDESLLSLLDQIFKINANHPNKLIIYPIDVDSDYLVAARTLRGLIDTNLTALSNPLTKFLFTNSFSKFDNDLEKEFFNLLLENSQVNFSDQCFMFQRIIEGAKIEGQRRGLAEKVSWESSQLPLDIAEAREAFLCTNVLSIGIIHPNRWMFGSFGKAHVEWKNSKGESDLSNYKSLSHRLQFDQKSPYKGTVCTIEICYWGAKSLTGILEYEGYQLTKEGSKAVKRKMSSYFSTVNFSKNRSLFKNYSGYYTGGIFLSRRKDIVFPCK